MRPLAYALGAALLLFGAILGAFVLFAPGGGDGRLPEDDGPGGAGAAAGGEGAAPRGGSPLAGGPAGESPGGAPSPRPPPAAGSRTGTPENPSSRTHLPRGTSEIAIEVLDGAGNPRPGMIITLLSGLASEESVSDATGVAVFSAVSPGTYSFRLRGDGVPELVGARELTVDEGEAKTVTVTVGGFDLAISGRVLDRGGKPVPDMTIVARKQLFTVEEGDFITASGQDASAVTGADGKYMLDKLEAGDYLLRTTATQRYPATSKVFRAGTTSADLVLEVGRDLEVYGKVASRDGTPLADVVVTAVGQTARQGRSDASGAYSLLLALADEQSVYALKAKREGFRESQVNILKAEVGEAQNWQVDISLEPIAATAPVNGVVIDPEENPVAGETVMLYSSVLSDRYKATTTADGRFSFGEVQVGEYRLWIYPQQRFKDYAREPVRVPEEGLVLELELEPIETGILRGTMVDPLGNPVPRFSLWLRSTSALNNSLTVSGDDAGRFEVEGVPTGELLFETRSFPRLTVRGLELSDESPEQATDVSLVLDWGEHQLAGVVVDEAEAPVAGARVTLHWSARKGRAQCSSVRHAVADETGRFTFSELAPVEHKLTVTAVNFNPEGVDFHVGGGDPDPVIHLRRKPGR